MLVHTPTNGSAKYVCCLLQPGYAALRQAGPFAKLAVQRASGSGSSLGVHSRALSLLLAGRAHTVPAALLCVCERWQTPAACCDPCQQNNGTLMVP